MPNENKGTSILGMLPAIGGAVAGVGQMLGIGEKRQDKRQLEQQGKLSEQQREINHRAQMDLWNATNYGAQVEHLKDAGLNPALLYGKGGGGGATVGTGVSGGMASDSASATRAGTGAMQGMAMLPAQIELIKAQTENVKADTAKKAEEIPSIQAGVKESGARLTAQEFQNEVNKLIGAQTTANKGISESQKAGYDESIREIEASRAGAEWESYVATGYKGKTYDDPSAPINKALKAGWDKTIIDLEKAKADKNLVLAETVLREFEANLTKEGIAPGSPWYIKIMMDAASKLGYSPTKL